LPGKKHPALHDIITHKRNIHCPTCKIN